VTLSRWIFRSLIHYRLLHLATGLAAAIATAALTGGLAVGDSVRETLRYAMEARLGQVHAVILARERFYREELGRRLNESKIENAPVLQVQGIVSRGDGSIRVSHVTVLGVDDRFFRFSPSGEAPPGFGDPGIFVNTPLAARLKLESDKAAEVVVRMNHPSSLSRNTALAPATGQTIAARLPITGMADDLHYGRFGLRSNQQAPLNAFVPLAWLQKQLKRTGQVNLLLIEDLSDSLARDRLGKVLRREWRLADAEAELRFLKKQGVFELRSARVFLEEPLSLPAQDAHPDAVPLLTYFVNELRVGPAATPYSVVTAVDPVGGFADILPEDMADDQIVINQWLADDLQAGTGDILTLTYFLPSGNRPLEEKQRRFRIRRVVPLEGSAADPTLMPNFPGLAQADSCSEWDPGLPIDLDRIRGKDEAYWNEYRGTPKAFITLAAGKAMWANRYGILTAVRFPIGNDDQNTMADRLRTNVDPAAMGLFATPVRDPGTKARSEGTDFSQLFLGLSMFLIASGVLLTGLLFAFAVEDRQMQTGMLMAVGFPAKRIRRIYLLEGGLVALTGALAGTFLGLMYTRLLIYSLSTVWQGAVAGTAIRYAASYQSQCIGFAAGFAVALLAMTWTLRRQMKGSTHSLLAGNKALITRKPTAAGRRWAGRTLLILPLLGAFLLVAISPTMSSGGMAGAFFGAGALLLLTALAGCGMALRRLDAKISDAATSLLSLSLRNNIRKSGRSLAVVAILACSVFMVVAVGANRKDPRVGAQERSSGTGGFALYAESAIPVMQDLNSEKARLAWGLEDRILGQTRFVPLRVRDGDDASCLNLNRAQEPRIIGVSADELASRRAFAFREIHQVEYLQCPWELLQQDLGDGVVPAIGDYPTVYWGLGKAIGSELIYPSHKGGTVRLRIVAMIPSSMLQGNLMISEAAMGRYFPGVEGYRAWLIDAVPGRQTQVSEHLTKRLADVGFSVETATGRLLAFSQVENTYLSIFLVLGAFGLVLGCAGLGLVVVRNTLERQGELAMLRATGFGRRTLLKMVCWEHIVLLSTGIFAGLICALVAVAPAIRLASGQLPIGLLAILTLMIGLSGLLWVLVAAGFALKGDILTPLRNE